MDGPRATENSPSDITSPMPPQVTASQHSLLAQLDANVFDPQAVCPLFCILPSEIRFEIYSLALLSYDDPARPYPLDEYYRRPGYTHYQLIATALLATCRRVYSETHDLVVAQTEHVFWARDKYRVAPTARSADPHKYFQCMTAEQRSAVRCVHVFGRLSWFNATHLPVLRALGVSPTLLKITHLYSNLEWSQGEMGADGAAEMILTMPRAELALQEMGRLERLEIEVEAMSDYEVQVEEASKAQFKRTFNLPKGRVLTTVGNEVTRARYMTNVEAIPVLDNVLFCYSWKRSETQAGDAFGEGCPAQEKGLVLSNAFSGTYTVQELDPAVLSAYCLKPLVIPMMENRSFHYRFN